MAAHNDFGKEGEQDAVNFLIENGHTILERNFRFGHAEIDIISRKDNILHIVEVKTRNSSAYGYIQKTDLDLEVQFDIISIVKNNVEFTINYIEDAFYPF